MNYQELEINNSIVPYNASKDQIEKELKLAKRDLRVAQKNLEEDFDWSFAIAYNAVLQASRAYMLSKGYRPRGTEQHRTVFRFVEISLGKEFEEKIQFLDKMRVKRHKVIYDEPELISESEAKFAIQIAAEFVRLVNYQIKIY